MTLAARPAARILLIDPAGRILLFRFVAEGRAPFWATPGGAVDPGESFEDAARRELLEETGIDMDCGPQVARREVEFVTLEDVAVAADERYFVVRADAADICTARHTELERRVMQEWRWFDPDELPLWGETIFPEDLKTMIEDATR